MNGRGTRGEWRKGKRYDGEEGVSGWRGLPSPQRGTTRTTFHSATPRAARGARDKRRLGGKGKAGGTRLTHPSTHPPCLPSSPLHTSRQRCRCDSVCLQGSPRQVDRLQRAGCRVCGTECARAVSAVGLSDVAGDSTWTIYLRDSPVSFKSQGMAKPAN